MSEHEQKHDPWANLADALGAKPVAEPAAKPVPKPPAQPAAPPEAVTPPPASARPPQKPREEKPAPAVRSDWGGLASALGLEPGAEPKTTAQTGRPQPAQPLPPSGPPTREAVEPPQRRSEREQDEFSFGNRRPAAESVSRGREPGDSIQRRDQQRPPRAPESRVSSAPEAARPIGERPESDTHDATDRDRAEPGSAPRGGHEDEQQGEGRGRRRRGRRGGRGRGGSRREEPRDRPLPSRLDDEQATGQDGGRWPAATEEHDGFDEPRPERLDHQEPGGSLPREAGAADLGGSRRESDGDDDRDADGAPRRRRRRGRRGGRRRGRGEREGETGSRPQSERDVGGPTPDAADRSPRSVDGDFEDEPLPGGYGVRSPARPGESGRSEPPRREASDAASTAKSEDREGAESGGRRRRRRRRGEGRSRDARGTDTPAESGRDSGTARRSTRSADGSSPRGRRGRRSTGEERRSASTFERGRRDEFAPVAGGREEDDEGLEFLGIEEAGHDVHGRDDRHPADDDSIIESGLNEVLDVPSWVEAIGIVIAGNLDARSRPPRSGESDRGRGGEPRGDTPPRGGSARDSRRGGRSGDQR